jgi:hypothetical protein
MRHTPLSLLLFSSLSLAACGGKVLFGDDDGEGGNGGSGGTSTNVSTSPANNSTTTSSTMTSSVQSVSVSTTGGGEAPFDCKSGCITLYECGLQDGLCPGFDGSPMQQQGFLEGCVEGCSDQPVLLDLINGEDCPGTIATIKGVSADFAEICDGAPLPPG